MAAPVPRSSREYTDKVTTSKQTPTQALFDAFCLARRVEAAAPKTLKHYREAIQPFAQSASEITPATVYAYLDSLRTRISLASYRSYVIDFKSFLRWLHTEEHLDKIIKIATPQLPEVIPPTYTREQITALFKAIDRSRWFGARDFTLLHILWDTGCRSDELCRIRRQDVNITTGRFLRLFGKGRGGKQKERLVGISQTTVRVLRRWMARHRGSPSDYLFPSLKGSRLTTTGLRQMIERRCHAIGIKVPRCVHAWRHTFAVHAYERGADISDLKDDLGHTRYETVDRYRRATALARQVRHDRYSPVEGE